MVVGGAALGVVAYGIQVDQLHSPPERAAATVLVGFAFLGAGLVAWIRRPENGLGRLLVLAGFAALARQLRYSHDPLVFTVFFALGDVGYALVGHSALAYPFGRVRARAERALVTAGYAVVTVLPAAALLFHGPHSPMVGYPRTDPRPRESLIHVATSDRAVELIQKAEILLFFGVIATLFIAVIVRRLVAATPRMRRVLAPLVVAAVAIGLRAIFECVFTFWKHERPFAYDVIFWWQVAATIALPLALLAGLLRARLARAAIGDLLVQLERTPVQELRPALARALGDPTVELALWLPDRREYVDAAGRPVMLPDGRADRAVTRIDQDGEPLAALVHDPSLVEEPRLVQAAGAAARLALQNARLQAELRVQLTNVEQSRARVVAAADGERRRIERDLHDGAQQRLVAIALELQRAQRRLAPLDPDVERLLATTVDDLQAALEELRELAHGIHPTILAEGGLAAALDTLARRSPVTVTVDATAERFTPEVEAAAYFVASEALANVAKHAGASTATVAARRRDGALVVEVCDDGVGGAALADGSGLRGLADRVEAHGGRLSVESPRGGGTRVVGEIPCAW